MQINLFFKFQISVNIGSDPSGISGDSLAVNIQSPGMVSLNSVGTGSPVATPAPTPTPPIVVPTTQSCQTNPSSKNDSAKENSASNETNNLESEKVIQELKPVEILSRSSKPDNTKEKLTQPSSPTKSFLTQFPVVKEKPTKSESAEKEVTNMDQTKMQSILRTHGSAKQPDLSVFDFSESRSDNILIDFSKHGQSLVSKSSASQSAISQPSSSRWSTAKPVTTASKHLTTVSSAPTKHMSSVSSYTDKVSASPYSDKPVLTNQSYSHPVNQSTKGVSYSSYNIPSSGNTVSSLSSGNLTYQKPSVMTRSGFFCFLILFLHNFIR